MKRMILITTLVMVAASSIIVTGCGGRGETISATNVQGAGKVSANDGTGPESKEQPAKDVPADVEVTKGLAKAKAHAGTAYSITGTAHAEKAAAAPAASKADAMSTATSTSAFKLKQDGKKVTLTVDDHFTVTLKGDDAKATIHIEAKISKGGGAVATLDKTYEFKPNVADPVNKIDISNAHTETIANGIGKGYQEKAATQATLDKGDYTMELKLTITTSGSVLAEAIVDKLEMSLPQ